MSSIPLSFAPSAPLSRSATAGRRSWAAYAACFAALMVSVKLHRFWQARFNFDDAYMYCRYAYNFRHGGGIAWNPGGPHTFGVTSLPWFFVVLAGSFVVEDNATLLTWASCLTGLLALAALAWVTSREAKSRSLQQPALLFAVLVAVLLLNWRFALSWSNGMETMLGMLSVVLLVGADRSYRKQPQPIRFAGLVLSAALCALVRPELILVSLSLPLVSWWLQAERRRDGFALRYLSALSGLLGLELIANWRYFGTPVPLAFYLKAMHGYDGYRLCINPWTYAAIFFSIGLPAVLMLTTLAGRKHVPMLLVYLVPLLLELGYLATVTQIMGAQGRYYVPLLPLLLMPALLLLDEALCTGTAVRLAPVRVALLLGSVLLSREYTQQVTDFIGNRLAARVMFFEAPHFVHPAAPELPHGEIWKDSAAFASFLPAGTTLAATEVGILGASAPAIRILDLAGLNDSFMAHHPSDVHYVLAEKPDVIWLPHADYTKLYGSLAASPELLEEYEVYAGALKFGVAVRKSSMQQPAFATAVHAAWRQLYPEYAMERYRVQQVLWDPALKMRGEPTDVLE